MLSPATPSVATMDFPTFLNTVMLHGGLRNTKDYALDHGVDEAALVRFANGAASVYEHETIQRVVNNCEWARGFITSYIKSRRRKRVAA